MTWIVGKPIRPRGVDSRFAFLSARHRVRYHSASTQMSLQKRTEMSTAKTTFALVVALVLLSPKTEAQVKLDPRLAAMRTIWVEAEDPLSDAPSVARCFATEVSGVLPLTLPSEKAASQVLFGFRQSERRIELEVSLHDSTTLWSVTTPLMAAVAGADARCETAKRLIEYLRDAMKSARDGLWYQQPADPKSAATVALEAEVAKLEKQTNDFIEESRAKRQVVETRFEVLDASYQITEQNRVFWRFSWKMRVKNYGPDNIAVSPSVDFKNRGGYVVDSDSEAMLTIRAQDTAEITGMALIDVSVAPTVSAAVGRARRIR